MKTKSPDVFRFNTFDYVKVAKNGRKVEIWPKIGSFSRCPRAIFFGKFFSRFFLHQCIHRDHTPRCISIYRFLLSESLKKGPKVTLPPKMTAKVINDF